MARKKVKLLVTFAYEAWFDPKEVDMDFVKQSIKRSQTSLGVTGGDYGWERLDITKITIPRK